MYIELRHLRSILKIHETGSLANAAEHLFVTQSALSHQIKSLENYFDVPLFHRQTRPLRLTAAGEELLQTAQQVVPLVESTENRLKAISHGDAGRLHIGIECHSCFEWLLPTLSEFSQNWPKVDTDLSLGFSFTPLDALARGDLDLVITSDPAQEEDLHFEPLFQYESKLVVGKHHPLADQEFVQPEDVRDETLVIYPVEPERMDLMKCFLLPAKVRPKHVRTAEVTAMIIHQVAAGKGVAGMPSWGLWEFEEKGYVRSLSLGKEGCWRNLYAAVRKSDCDSEFVQSFLNLAKQISQSNLQGIREA